MKYSVQHGLSDISQVRAVVDKAYEAYKERLASHNPTLSWNGDDKAKIEFSVMGKSIATDVRIDEKELNIEGDLPWAFKFFEKKILDVVGGEVDKWLEKARNGEL